MKITKRTTAPRAPSDPMVGARAEAASENTARCSSRLLVSVRNAAESLVALEGGASFIDVKEPANGPLGRAPREVQLEVVDTVRSTLDRSRHLERRVIVTAALGELLAGGSPTSYSPVHGFSLFKLGLSDCCGSRNWMERLDAWRERVRMEAADLAAVAYADHAAARAPEPREILDYAIDRRLPFLLIDTYGKKAGSLRDFYCDRELVLLLEEAHRHDVLVALAGSLRPEDLHPLQQLGADVLAVRGTACRHGRREADLDPDRIRELVRLLRKPTAVAR